MGIGGVFYRTFGRRFSSLLLFSAGGGIFLDIYVSTGLLEKNFKFLDN